MTGSRWLVLKLISALMIVSASVVTGMVLLSHVALNQPRSQPSDAAWTVVDVRTLPTPANFLYVGPIHLVSPDGGSVIWIENLDMLCLMALPSSVRWCRPFPSPPSYTISLSSLSPDSRFLLLLDGNGEFRDIYVFDLATGKLHLVQDDQYVVSRPVWNVPGGDAAAYYFTYEYDSNVDVGSTMLRRFSMTSQDTTIIDLSTIFGEVFLPNGVVAVSPDDSRFVVLLRQRVSRDFGQGLWLVDITSQTAEHLASYSDLAIGPDPNEVRTFDNRDMVWDEARNRLLVFAQSPSPPFNTLNILSIDLDSGDITPLLTTANAMAWAGQASFMGGHVTPDAAFFFFYAELTDEPPYHKTIFAVPLATLPEAEDLTPILVTDDHMIDCLPMSALITLAQADGTQRRYIYEPAQFCPG